MDPVQSIAKPSKGLRNLSGVELEKKYSKDFHAKGVPLLISPALLRERNLGQIDLARITKQKNGFFLEIGEVKSSLIGCEVYEFRQRQRLLKAQQFLSSLFGFSSKVVLLVK